jgi:biotin operon repressor
MAMTMKQVLEIVDLLDDARASGERVASLLRSRGLEDVEVTPIQGERGKTDSIKIFIPGGRGRSSGGTAPTLGIIGRLGGIGARPEMIGLVSDADGAIAAIAVALKLADMKAREDVLPGDVIVATHVCPDAPTQPHEPVPFMGSPVDVKTLNVHEVDPRMEAILSIDATKGNRIIKQRGFAISPTVKEGYILKVSEDLLTLMEITAGRRPAVFAITTQDITPYGNGLFHLNSIMQPAVATQAPVVGVAITAESVVPGCATGANHATDLEEAARFCIEVAKRWGSGQCRFHDEEEFSRIVALYGSMGHLQTLGKEA